MSMTYYAVTDDPNELAHFGIKGMKWGVRHDKPRHSGSRKPRSAAYKKAQNKLGRMMKSGIKKAEAHWREYNSPKAKEERFMKKAMQGARDGTLRYGTLTDSQVRRITDRLYLERQARQLGNTEKSSFGKRVRSAVGTGIVEGLGRGTASYINARLEGRGRSTAELKAQKRREKYESKESTIRRKAKKEAKQELYKDLAVEGKLYSRPATVAKLGVLAVKDPLNLAYRNERALLKASLTQKGRADLLKIRRKEDKESERRRRQEESRDKAYYTAYGKLEADNDYKKVRLISSDSEHVSGIHVTSSEPKSPRGPSVRIIRHKPTRRKPGGGKRN